MRSADEMPGLVLPYYGTYGKLPFKIVETPSGGMQAWRLDWETGGWKPANDRIDKVLFAVGGEDGPLTREEFVQETEMWRAHYGHGEGEIKALYDTVRAIFAKAREEGRRLTDEERALVRGIRRKTFVMFEEKLQREGNPGADPSIAYSE
jgi:hypothetical protein